MFFLMIAQLDRGCSAFAGRRSTLAIVFELAVLVFLNAASGADLPRRRTAAWRSSSRATSSSATYWIEWLPATAMLSSILLVAGASVPVPIVALVARRHRRSALMFIARGLLFLELTTSSRPARPRVPPTGRRARLACRSGRPLHSNAGDAVGGMDRTDRRGAARIVLAMVLGESRARRTRLGLPRREALRATACRAIACCASSATTASIAFDGLYFSLNPRESQSLYRTAAHQPRRPCRAQQLPRRRIARRSRPPRRPSTACPSSLVASIIQVESGCGANTGRSRVAARRSRASSMARGARNLVTERPIGWRSSTPSRSPADVASFASLARAAPRGHVLPRGEGRRSTSSEPDATSIRSRSAAPGSGALGIPQFLPRSYLWYGVDGNQDGQREPLRPGRRDPVVRAATSSTTAGSRASRAPSKRNVIWGYNHSDAYIDTVLWLADEVESRRRRSRRREPARSAKKQPRAGAPVVARQGRHATVDQRRRRIARRRRTTKSSSRRRRRRRHTRTGSARAPSVHRPSHCA